jgi:hypothetical protein
MQINNQTKGKTMKEAVSGYYIKLSPSGRYVVDAPPIGFRSTTSFKKATRFEYFNDAKAFCKDRGIFNAYIIFSQSFPVG